jgi:raffinose/stachyose/melibiose transport system permease protein
LRHRNLKAWLLCAPALIVVCTFFIGPALVGFFISFHEWDGVSSQMRYVGLNNYLDLLASARFWHAMAISWVFAFATLFLQIPIALFFAVILSRKGRFYGVYRTAMIIPQALSIAAVALVWGLMYDPSSGLINRALRGLGMSQLQTAWLGEPLTAIAAILLTSTWFYFGFHMLLFLAGISAIPADYYDAARLETNSTWTVTRTITIPLIREQLLISFLLVFAGAFGGLVGLISLMTFGGPSGATEIGGVLADNLALRGGQFGSASAISVIILVIVLAVMAWPTYRLARNRLEFT